MPSLSRHNSDREPNNNMIKCSSDHSDNARYPSSSYNQQVCCHITTADNHVYQVQIDHKSEASQVLKKICKMLGIMDESEYFGLQYRGKQNELLWLNLRNQLTKQLHTSPPYSLFLKVKYFVQPQRLIQEETKRQFFLNIVEHFQKGEWLNLDASLENIGEMIALMTHTNYGSFNQTTTPCKYGCFWPESRGEIPNDALRIAAAFHQSLNQQNHKNTQYEVMRRAHSSLVLYGTHFFEVVHMYGKQMKIGIGPEKLFMCHCDGSLVEEMLYARLHMVYLSAKIVTLKVLDDAGQAKDRQYELKTRLLAQSMYRCITEIHAFFKSENISAQVLEQTTNRNVLDSITSLFEHHKEFAFDVMKTAQEVYDQALRNAYRLSQASSVLNRENFFGNCKPTATSPRFCLPDDYSPPLIPTKFSIDNKPSHRPLSSSESTASDISSQVEEVIQEELKSRTQCQFCCNEEINRVFTPCGHAVCCAVCSERVEECPVCRSAIETRQIFFPPWSSNSSSSSALAGAVLQRAHMLIGQHSHSHHHHYHLHENRTHDQPKEESVPQINVQTELNQEQKSTITGPTRQFSLSVSSSHGYQIHDPRRIRTYSDFQVLELAHNFYRNNSTKVYSDSMSPPIMRSLDLADDLSVPAKNNNPENLSVTISTNLSGSATSCNAELVPNDPPARVSSGVPSILTDSVFHLDDTSPTLQTPSIRSKSRDGCNLSTLISSPESS